ncbi:MAG: hypothetical protein JWN60_1601 [Acidobacteria bacterium]|jgi:membrane protein insertase Oxa1/YidC/SpoIIIJ|nr:hypothetical protein [Acidobacteriota bacterium]
MSEEIKKYQRQWEHYQDKKGQGCLMAIIILPALGALVYISRNFPHYSSEALFGIIVVFGISAVVYFYMENFKCPRCKMNFDYRKTNTPTEKCINCKLPIFYGSSYFFDYWGMERGSNLIEENKNK